jgi:hypothetical protein
VCVCASETCVRTKHVCERKKEWKPHGKLRILASRVGGTHLPHLVSKNIAISSSQKEPVVPRPFIHKIWGGRRRFTSQCSTFLRLARSASPAHIHTAYLVRRIISAMEVVGESDWGFQASVHDIFNKRKASSCQVILPLRCCWECQPCQGFFV